MKPALRAQNHEDLVAFNILLLSLCTTFLNIANCPYLKRRHYPVHEGAKYANKLVVVFAKLLSGGIFKQCTLKNFHIKATFT